MHSIVLYSTGANSELTSVHLFKSYCLAFMLYATVAIPFSKTTLRTLDGCIELAIVNFSIYVTMTIQY